MNSLRESLHQAMRVRCGIPPLARASNRGIASTTKKSTFIQPSTSNLQDFDVAPRHTSDLSYSAQQPVRNEFTDLVASLTHILTDPTKPCDVPALISLLRNQSSLPPSTWAQFAHRDPKKQYTRNLVASIPSLFNLLLLVWTPGKASPIHDHVDSHCIMHILSGSLIERRFAWPNPSSAKQMEQTAEAVYRQGKVAYICDNMGLHSIENPSNTEFACSLHLYTPPNAAIRGCRVFDGETGVGVQVLQCPYDSVGGKPRGEL